MGYSGEKRAVNFSFALQGTLGIEIGRDKISACYKRSGSALLESDWMETVELTTPLAGSQADGGGGGGIASLKTALRQLLLESKKHLGKSNVFSTVQVSIPDPLVNFAVFDFESTPPSAKVLAELIKMRFAQEYFTDARQMEFSHSVLESNGKNDSRNHNRNDAKNGNSTRVIGLAVGKDWIDCINDVVQESGMALAVVDAAACYRFAQLPMLKYGDAGAWLILDSGYWSIIVWDENQQPQYLKSRWREDGFDGPSILSELKRIVKSMALGAKNLPLRKLYFSILDGSDMDQSSIYRNFSINELSALETGAKVPGEFSCSFQDAQSILFIATQRC